MPLPSRRYVVCTNDTRVQGMRSRRGRMTRRKRRTMKANPASSWLTAGPLPVSSCLHRRQQVGGGFSSCPWKRHERIGSGMMLLVFHRWTGVACTLRIIQVDMSQKLTELGLIDLMPAQIWPPMCAVRELATRIKRNSKGLRSADEARSN